MNETTAENGRRPRRGHGRPTLHDVAAVAQVTRITVSRYLREPHLVAPDTAERIQAAIAQTGYVRNLQAGQLASGRSRMVAALIPNVGHSIFGESIQGLVDGLHDTEYELLLMPTGYSLEREEAQLRALAGWGPAALVVTGRHHTPGALRLLRDAQQAGTPVVEIWDCSHAAPAADGAPALPQIGFDHHAVGRAVAEHLLALGHRSLAFVASAVSEDYRASDRCEGFLQAVQAAGAQVRVFRANAGDVFDAGRALLGPLRSADHGRITAVGVANDQLACGLLLEAQATGVAVPQALSVVGFGDFPLGNQMRPRLSTVRPPREEIGRATARALLAALDAEEPVRGCELPWQLIDRGSTGPVG
ncbi:LacI family DNA-binding transcriptional regulator [uncultured Aquincola sp.]|uniref:LacI family DNA-binding transcriptional regulator n=1 Tax=uncultured Aquincola sp. TaxID=886556 RepID=UPI0032B12894